MRPVAAVWNWWGLRRFANSNPYRCALPVVCVGNFTAGGSGKTPMALEIASILAPLGVDAYFLTRGYGGRISGPHLVDVVRDSARDVGDEALLLARQSATVVARNRAEGAKFIEKLASAQAKRAAIIMDDGLQNPSLAKDLSIALVDAVRGIGNGLTIPAGPLRISLEFQLRLADVIVVNNGVAGDPAGSVAGWLREKFPGPVLEASQSPAGDTGWLDGARVIAFAGIANPRRFFDLVESLGGICVDRIAYADHHTFTSSEAEFLLRRAGDAGAQLVTTEKDHVRLSGSAPLRDLQRSARPIAIKTAFAGRDQVRMRSLIEGILIQPGDARVG
jgi:tetraacyldisaccharide 4'-kinase